MNSTHSPFVLRHLKFGWWSLFVFVGLGMVLEMLHGFKVGWYLDASNETRRLMLTLSHAHGTLLSIIHITLANTLRSSVGTWSKLWRKFASPGFMAASVLLPGGFFLGGIVFYDGDPGLGIFLVPIGGFVLLFSIFLTASQIMKAEDHSGSETDIEKPVNT